MNDKKLESAIKHICSRLDNFKLLNAKSKNLKLKHINRYFKQTKELIKLTKVDIENIQPIFQKRSDFLNTSTSDTGRIKEFYAALLISTFGDGVFDKELGKKNLTAIIKLCINCEEDKQYIISGLDILHHGVVLAEKNWIKDKKFYGANREH